MHWLDMDFQLIFSVLASSPLHDQRGEEQEESSIPSYPLVLM
jgi:hypothetical protein